MPEGRCSPTPRTDFFLTAEGLRATLLQPWKPEIEIRMSGPNVGISLRDSQP